MDADRGRCSWLANGEQCHYAGSIAHGTRGTKFFCRGHFNCVDQAEGQRIVEASREHAQDAPHAPRAPSRTPTPSRLPYVDDSLE